MINGVRALALCPQVLSQAPQHFSKAETGRAVKQSFVPKPNQSHIWVRLQRGTHPEESCLHSAMEIFEEVQVGTTGLGPADEGVDFSLTLLPQRNPQLDKHLQRLCQVGQ